MSFLNRIKQHVTEASEKRETGTSETVPKHQANWIMLAPRCKFIVMYMEHLAEHLNATSLNDRMGYALTKHITIKGLKRSNFRVKKTDGKSIKDFSLCYDMVGDTYIDLMVENNHNADIVRQFLKEQSINALDSVSNHDNVMFNFFPKITVIFQYIADIKNCVVISKIHNFDRKETWTNKYTPSAITTELMDETTKYILRQENKLSTLSGHSVSDETLIALRNQLKKDGKIPSK